jgi:hypothetical protein
MANLNSTTYATIQATNSEYVELGLLTLYLPGETLRLVNNTVDVVSRGNTYTRFPFQFELPNDDGETVPKMKLTIQNMDDRIIQGVRELTSPLSMLLEIVSTVDPDFVIVSVDHMELKSVGYNSLVIEGTVEVNSILSRAFPSDRYTGVQFPALFA